jgi:hypothetical protein
MNICDKLRWTIRACGLFCAVLPACGQRSSWDMSIAKVSVRAELNRAPATAFVVAIRNQTAFLVTSAHVVAGDDSPMIEFRADPDHPQKAILRNIQGADPDHGLALLAVYNPPASVQALALAGGARPVAGQAVRIAGYPAQMGGFLAPSTTIAGVNGQDLILALQTDEGFSGGPVLREDGSVVGLVWGHSGSYGVAMVAELVKLYLDGNDLEWGRRPDPLTAASPVPSDLKTECMGGSAVACSNLWKQQKDTCGFDAACIGQAQCWMDKSRALTLIKTVCDPGNGQFNQQSCDFQRQNVGPTASRDCSNY